MNYFSSDTLYQSVNPSIDKEKGIIKNVLVVSEGEAKGHNLFLNQEFLDCTVVLGNQPAKGIKARFGHPNMCSTALGTYIGRYKNFHKQDSNVLADLHLDETARISPNGNLYDYILSLAASNPDSFGSSIAFKCGKINTLTEKDPTTQEELSRNYATIESLHAVDLVDEPAATNGLFAQFHANDWAYTATLFFNQNPAIINLLANNPYVFIEFLTKYLNNNNMTIPEEFKKFKEKIFEIFQKNNIQNPVNQIEELESQLETMHYDSVAKDNLIVELETSLSKSVALAEELQSQVDLLSANKTVPPLISDPKLNINKSISDEDTAGKALLKELPYQDRIKLKSNS